MTIADAANYIRPNASAEPCRYPVNLRITLPLPKPIFITLIIGAEKRGKERLKAERERHPVNTWGNLIVAIGAWTVLSVATLFVAMVAAGL